MKSEQLLSFNIIWQYFILLPYSKLALNIRILTQSTSSCLPYCLSPKGSAAVVTSRRTWWLGVSPFLPEGEICWRTISVPIYTLLTIPITSLVIFSQPTTVVPGGDISFYIKRLLLFIITSGYVIAVAANVAHIAWQWCNSLYWVDS